MISCEKEDGKFWGTTPTLKQAGTSMWALSYHFASSTRKVAKRLGLVQLIRADLKPFLY